MMKKVLVAVLFFASALSTNCARVLNRTYHLSPLEYRVKVEKDVMVPARDGALLATDLYRPEGVSQAPVILVRTPYDKSSPGLQGLVQKGILKLFARHGYIVAVQDCRGRYNSEGDFYPFLSEAKDGHDALRWAASAAWSSGELGSWGGSYFGFTQWAMADASPELKAMVPIFTCANIANVIYEGGCLNFSNMLLWAAGNRGREGEAISPRALKSGFWKLPVMEADDAVVKETVDFYDDAVTFRALNFMSEVDYEDRYRKVSAAAFSIAGWYDLFQPYQIYDFQRLLEEGQGNARAMSRMLIGPWGHGIYENPPVKFKEAGILKMGAVDMVMDFYDQLLKGEDRGVENWPRYTVYVMGADQWLGLEEWPPPDMTLKSYYFHSQGRANTRQGDGTLSPSPPGEEKPDTFVYDPADPVPTLGGPLLGTDLGPKNQEPVEKREDVLVYTTPSLSEPLAVMGPVKVVLYAATDGKDTDFTAKLCDVFPNGLSINITDGVIRGRFREGDLTRPSLLEPGRTYEFTIDLWHTAYVFQPGHRIRVQISSSNFPRFDRNLNTGEDIATSSRMRKAKQTVFHDRTRPSHLLLPVVSWPRDGQIARR